MPDYQNIENSVQELATFIEGRLVIVDRVFERGQRKVYELAKELLLQFEISAGSYRTGQDFRKQLRLFQKKVEKVIFGKEYTLPITDFLADLTTIQDKAIELHKTVSNLEIEVSKLAPARQLIYENAKTALLDKGAIATGYIDPMKRLIANNVIQGRSIAETVKLLEKWNDGELASGRLSRGVPAPNLQKYATQMARDSAYSVQRTTNEIFKEHFGLKSFIYVGNLVGDSRPLCRHLVQINRPISLDEMPELIRRYPEGLYPGTTKENFMNVCGGYSCRHVAHAVG